jgi:hypothetical protein
MKRAPLDNEIHEYTIYHTDGQPSHRLTGTFSGVTLAPAPTEGDGFGTGFNPAIIVQQSGQKAMVVFDPRVVVTRAEGWVYVPIGSGRTPGPGIRAPWVEKWLLENPSWPASLGLNLEPEP